MSADASGGRAFRQPAEIQVPAAGAVVAVDRQPWLVVVDEAGEEL